MGQLLLLLQEILRPENGARWSAAMRREILTRASQLQVVRLIGNRPMAKSAHNPPLL